jgi:hypothetical protein
MYNKRTKIECTGDTDQTFNRKRGRLIIQNTEFGGDDRNARICMKLRNHLLRVMMCYCKSIGMLPLVSRTPYLGPICDAFSI